MGNVYQPKLVQIRPIYDTNPDTGDHPENVLWAVATNPGTPTLADLAALSFAFDTKWSAAWATWGPGDKHYLGSVITDWSSSAGLSEDSRTTWTPTAGGVAGHSFPPNVAILLSYDIGVRYKGGHPRTYLPWVAAGVGSSSDPSQVQAGQLPVIQAQFTGLAAALSAAPSMGGYTQVIYRHRNNPATAAFFPVRSVRVNAQLATQRRRMRRVAHH